MTNNRLKSLLEDFGDPRLDLRPRRVENIDVIGNACLPEGWQQRAVLCSQGAATTELKTSEVRGYSKQRIR